MSPEPRDQPFKARRQETAIAVGGRSRHLTPPGRLYKSRRARAARGRAFLSFDRQVASFMQAHAAALRAGRETMAGLPREEGFGRLAPDRRIRQSAATRRIWISSPRRKAVSSIHSTLSSPEDPTNQCRPRAGRGRRFPRLRSLWTYAPAPLPTQVSMKDTAPLCSKPATASFLPFFHISNASTRASIDQPTGPSLLESAGARLVTFELRFSSRFADRDSRPLKLARNPIWPVLTHS